MTAGLLNWFAFVTAMVVTMVLVPPLKEQAGRLSVMDSPGERKVHDAPIPRIGGIAMVIGALVPILMWASDTRALLALAVGIAIILFFGVWDDRADLDYRLKFGGQLLAALVVVLWGGVHIHHVPLGGLDPINPAISLPFTVFTILAVTNAINLADGLDGLAGGASLISLAAIALLAHFADDRSLLLVTLAIIGSIVGFLRYNTHPAQIFMGDGGSQYLGFSIAVLLVLLTQQSNPALSPAMPLLVVGLPVVDTMVVMGQRMAEGKSPFLADRNHLHHKLLALGLRHYEAVAAIYLAQATLVGTALVFRYHDDRLLLALFIGLLVSAMLLLPLGIRARWRLNATRAGLASSRIAQRAGELRVGDVFGKWTFTFVAASLPLYALYVALTAPPVSANVGWLAAALAGLFALFSLLAPQAPLTALERGLTYVAVTLLGYAMAQTPAMTEQPLVVGYFMLLTAAVALSFRYSRLRSAELSPLDMLVVVVAVTVPNIPGFVAPVEHFGRLVAAVFVLFYAMEVLVSSGRGRPLLIRLGLALLLAIHALRHGLVGA